MTYTFEAFYSDKISLDQVGSLIEVVSMYFLPKTQRVLFTKGKEIKTITFELEDNKEEVFLKELNLFKSLAQQDNSFDIELKDLNNITLFKFVPNLYTFFIEIQSIEELRNLNNILVSKGFNSELFYKM